MQVFDRWGQLMYDAKGGPGIGWNGEYKGKVMEVGVYVYQANVKFIDGTNEFVKGNVTLIR
jgi:gliding motility-associated-like protein